jgi:hypothetical protein
MGKKEGEEAASDASCLRKAGLTGPQSSENQGQEQGRETAGQAQRRGDSGAEMGAGQSGEHPSIQEVRLVEVVGWSWRYCQGNEQPS